MTAETDLKHVEHSIEGIQEQISKLSEMIQKLIVIEERVTTLFKQMMELRKNQDEIWYHLDKVSDKQTEIRIAAAGEVAVAAVVRKLIWTIVGTAIAGVGTIVITLFMRL